MNPYLTHLVSRVTQDLEFLSSQGLLSRSDVDQLRFKLESATSSSSNTNTNGIERAMSGMGINGKGKDQCKAVWSYTKSQPDDLGFNQGDVITIEEEVNADWWKGSLNGQTGLFPANHVERISSRTVPPPPPPPSHAQSYYSQSNSSYNNVVPPPSNHYGVPPPPSHHQPQQAQQYAYQQPQYYGSSSSSEKPNPYSTPPPPPPPQHQQPIVVSSTGPTVPVTEEEKKKKFPGGKFGKQIGTAFAGGAGFGAGSAITSNAINAIF